MADIIDKLMTSEECENLAVNALENGNLDLAQRAKRKAVELRARLHEANNDVEREGWEAVEAYEAVMTERRGKKFRAQRTRQMIARHGMTEAIKRAVNRDDDPTGYTSLAGMKMPDLSFEAIVIRHPDVFGDEVVQKCRERIARYEQIQS